MQRDPLVRQLYAAPGETQHSAQVWRQAQTMPVLERIELGIRNWLTVEVHVLARLPDRNPGGQYIRHALASFPVVDWVHSVQALDPREPAPGRCR